MPLSWDFGKKALKEDEGVGAKDPLIQRIEVVKCESGK